MHEKLQAIEHGSRYTKKNAANSNASRRKMKELAQTHAMTHHFTSVPTAGARMKSQVGTSIAPLFASNLHALMYLTSRKPASTRAHMLRSADPLALTSQKLSDVRANA